jgi:hypothetical protein
MVLAEGVLLAAVGALPGTLLGVLYAAGIVHALTTRWAGAVSATALWLHVDAGSLVAGGLSGLGVGILAAGWGVRRMTRRPVLDLLSGGRGMQAAAPGVVAGAAGEGKRNAANGVPVRATPAGFKEPSIPSMTSPAVIEIICASAALAVPG